MKTTVRKATWTCAGFAIAAICGSPAVADDTELLLVTPDPSVKPKPNVMLILDTSGSMKTTQTTSVDYDGQQSYPGACNADAVYYTDTPVVPVCDGNNEYYIDDDNWFCEGSNIQVNGVGQFTNTLIQYRDGGPDGTTSGPKMWQDLAPGYNSEPVDCLADYGIHGDGHPTRLWPKAGTDIDPWYTDDPAEAISFGGAPLNVTYTAYDGNYLNYLQTTGTTTMSRSDIMKQTAKEVLGNVSNMNVGIMRFNDKDGGPVIKAIQDLDTNRQALMDTIDALPNAGNTPLSETLYESALYWRGMPAHYGELFNVNPTDPAALASSGPEVYKQPEWDVCAKNYNVLLTDGEPREDFDTPALAPTLPNFAQVLGRNQCTFQNAGDCLDDVAEYLYKYDVDSTLLPGEQVVTTHTIGFTVDLPLLKDTAVASGGQYFLADDVESLTASLQEIIAIITEKSLSFAAPAVAVNTFNRTQTFNDLYITMFGVESKAHWPGNLKKYSVEDGVIVDANGESAVDPNTGFFFNTAKSFWTDGDPDGNDVLLGGAAAELPDPSSRRLFTNNVGTDLTAGINQVSPANLQAFSNADFGLTGATGEPTIEELIRWARGEDIRDEDLNPLTTVRNAMGDPLHAAPAAVVYGGTAAAPEMVVFTATNDGYLHAIDADTGEELWSFIPNQLLDNLPRLFFDADANFKFYGIDGNLVPVVRDVNGDGVIDPTEDFVYLIFGYRRGDTTYMALDVTVKDSPKVKWEISRGDLGQTWSTPVVARVEIANVTQNALNAVVVFGGGYDPVHDTAAASFGAGRRGGGRLHV